MRTRLRVAARCNSPSVAIVLLFLCVLVGGADLAQASHGGPHPGTWRHWDLVGTFPNLSPINGLDPHETIADPTGLTLHVGAPANLTSMENMCGGFCGLLYWNPITDDFKGYCVTGGFQFSADLDLSGAAGEEYSAGDAWTAVNGNELYSPYMNFAGTDSLRRWDMNVFSATGIRINPIDGQVFVGHFVTPGEIVELDPDTDLVRRWETTCKPYNLVIDPALSVVYATCVADGAEPDQIIKLDTVAGTLTRWPIPGSFRPTVGFGIHNGITLDRIDNDNVWFTETDSDDVAVLNVTSNCFDVYSKPPGMDATQDVSAAGSGATQQAYFTETDTGQRLGVISLASPNASPATTCILPTIVAIVPVPDTAIRTDFTIAPVVDNIIPTVTPVNSTNGLAIDRFPLPAGTSNPTAVTEVVFPFTLYGTFEGTDDVYEFFSEVIIGDPSFPTPNHYQVYDVDDVPFDYPMTLADQFTSFETRAGPIDFFANPVDKNSEGIPQPLEHMKWYPVTEPASIIRQVTLTNQFGDQVLTTRDAEYLLVPSEKNGEGAPGTCTAPQNSVGQPCVSHEDCDDPLAQGGVCGGLRHFLCYEADGPWQHQIVSLDDQFFSTINANILEPRYFCNPAEKTLPDCCNADLNGDGIVDAADFTLFNACFGLEECYDINCDGVSDINDFNILSCQFGTSPPDPACCPDAIPPGVYPIVDPLTHLACYDVFPKSDADIPVMTNDQLDQSDLLIRLNEMLCVPTQKLGFTENPIINVPTMGRSGKGVMVGLMLVVAGAAAWAEARRRRVA